MILKSSSRQVSYVLTGDLGAKNNFLQNLIEEEDIPGYNIFDYQDTLKILQVREIKKNLEADALTHRKRLFIIRDTTVEAQNALLKTLEELPEDTIFVFLDDSSLIPTILSRARIVNLEKQKLDLDLKLLELVSNFIDKPHSPLLFSEKIFSENPDLDFMDLIIILRKILLENLEKRDFEKSYLILKLLKSLYKYASLVMKNNLNKRILLEKILLT